MYLTVRPVLLSCTRTVLYVYWKKAGWDDTKKVLDEGLAATKREVVATNNVRMLLKLQAFG